MKSLFLLLYAMHFALYHCTVVSMERDKILANIQDVETMYAKTLAKTIEIVDGVKREEALLGQTEDVLQHEADDGFDALQAMRLKLVVATQKKVDLIYEDRDFEEESEATSRQYKRRLKRYHDKKDLLVECLEKNKKRRILLDRKRERIDEKYLSDTLRNSAIKAVSNSLLDTPFSTSKQALDIAAVALENSVKEMEERNRKSLQDEQFLTHLTKALENHEPATLPIVRSSSWMTTSCTSTLSNPHVDLGAVAKKFSKGLTVTGIDMLKNETVAVPFMHLLALEGKDRNSEGKIDFFERPTRTYSIHHDYKKFYEKNGHIQIVNKMVCPHTGCYTGTLSVHGCKMSKLNSFFPSYWRPEQVIDAIAESLKDKNKLIINRENNFVIVRGRTRDSYPLTIKTVIDCYKKKIVSSMPLDAVVPQFHT